MSHLLPTVARRSSERVRSVRTRHSFRALAPSAALALFATGCGLSSLPRTFPDDSAPSARQALLDAVEAQGGDVYERFDDIAVSYDGTWGRVIPRIQPELVDLPFRKRSEERLLLSEGVVAQAHTGPGGRKHVLRLGEGVEVLYEADDPPVVDSEREEAAALVADAYEMFLLGPSFFLRHGSSWMSLAEADLDGVACLRIAGRLAPGLGFSSEDRVILWIDREQSLLRRVHFTLEGTRPTQGAQVTVDFFDYRSVAGAVWPTRFEERVRAPLRLFAHRWTMTGLDVDRGMSRDELASFGFDGAARLPATSLDVSSDRAGADFEIAEGSGRAGLVRSATGAVQGAPRPGHTR